MNFGVTGWIDAIRGYILCRGFFRKVVLVIPKLAWLLVLAVILIGGEFCVHSQVHWQGYSYIHVLNFEAQDSVVHFRPDWAGIWYGIWDSVWHLGFSMGFGMELGMVLAQTKTTKIIILTKGLV